MTLIGAAVLPTAGQTWTQAIGAFEQTTGRPMPFRRCYDNTPPTSIAGGQLKRDVGLRQSIYSIKPTADTPTSDLDALAASIAAAQHPCDVIIRHEPVDEMTGDDFIALYQRCAPPFRAHGIPVGVCYTNWSINLPYDNQQSALAHYWPGPNLVDFLAIDEYPKEIATTGTATPMDARTLRVTQFADSQGVPLGLAEYAVDNTWPAAASETWLRTVTAWAQAREANGTPLRWMAYYSCDSPVGKFHYTLTRPEYVTAYTDSYNLL